MTRFGTLAGAALLNAYCAGLRDNPGASRQHLLGVIGVKGLADALCKLGDRRFLELVHRDDRVDEWARFADHETKRAKARSDTGWGNPQLAGLAAALHDWSAAYRNDPAVEWVNRRVSEVGVAPVLDDAHRRIALVAFRAALWRVWAGGVS